MIFDFYRTYFSGAFTILLRGVKLENYFGDSYIVSSSMRSKISLLCFMNKLLATVVLHW